MTAEKDLDKLLKTMKPKHNFGDYVFSVVDNLENIDLKNIVLIFKEPEGNTIIIEKDLADSLNLQYSILIYRRMDYFNCAFILRSSGFDRSLFLGLC